ncbi:MAG TPA: lysine--tRNA ligase [Gemmatimonadaceae bacterium]|nr:lysine--tRNA ligase [Gemmatimonadaceae bacterium]
MTDDLNFVLRARREKLEAIRAAGVEPFAYSYNREHTTAAALALLPDAGAGATTGGAAPAADGPSVSIAGRIVAWRAHGKTAFAHLADSSGRIQLYFRRDELGDDRYALLHQLDLSDIIGVAGPLFRTRTGEVTVRVASFEILAKSLRPLPFGKEEEIDGQIIRHSGFSDPEQRYRQRYADLAVHPEVRTHFAARSRMIGTMRSFLDGLGYLEVETPILQPQYGGAAARPFVTRHNSLDMALYLRIADELYLKRLVVGGFERVYEIGHDFRNEGIDRTHNPEFTMLEFYEAYADYTTMMGRVESLLEAIIASLRSVPQLANSIPSFNKPLPRLEWVPALNAGLGTDVLAAEDASLREMARRAGVEKPETLSRPKLMDELFQAIVESTIVDPTFILDYPVELSPLAKPKRGDARLTERFELFADGRELANSFSELNDPVDQRSRLEAQSRLRDAGDEEAVGVDEDYLRAMEYGMPPMGGVGVGVDRLFMWLTGTPNIRDAILFPTMRPE